MSGGSNVDRTVLLHPRVGHPAVRHPRLRLPIHFLRLRSLCSLPFLSLCSLCLTVRKRGRETVKRFCVGEDRPNGQSSSAQHVVAMQQKNRYACLIKGALDNGPPLLIMGPQVKIQCVISVLCIFLSNSFFICPTYVWFSLFLTN